MSGTHRTRKPWARVAGAVVALAAIAGLSTGAAAAARPNLATGVTDASTVAVNGATERANFRVVDNGSSIVITATGRGFRSNNAYVSLVYPTANCTAPEASSGQTLDGAWQNHGARQQSLYAAYTGQAYRAIRGNIKSVSVREVTAVTAGANGVFTATLTPRACATLATTR